MSDKKPVCFTKKFGTRKEVFDEIACMTRGGLTLEDLFLDDNGVIRSVKQCESLKKNQNNLVKKDKKVSKVVVEESDDSEVNDNSDPGEDVSANASKSRTPRTKAVPTKALNISDIKEAVSATLQKNNEKLPKGYSKWKKEQWLDKARELELVA
jgi:hypothetical protein